MLNEIQEGITNQQCKPDCVKLYYFSPQSTVLLGNLQENFVLLCLLFIQ